MIARKILIVAMLLALFGCVAPEAETEAGNWIQVAHPDGWSLIYRFIDEEAQVACWIYTGYKAAGISCLPLDETALDR